MSEDKKKAVIVLLVGLAVLFVGVFISLETSKEVARDAFESSTLWMIPGALTVGIGGGLLISSASKKNIKKGNKK